MSFSDRFMAAFNAFKGRVPQGNAVQQPYFFGLTSRTAKMSTPDPRINYQQLRKFSESAVVRRAIDYLKNQVSRLDWDIEAKEGKKLTAQQKRQIQVIKNILNNPNTDDNFVTFIGQIIEDMLVCGMGVTEIKKFPQDPDHPYILYPVDAASIQIYMDWDGDSKRRRYAQYDLQGNWIDFTPEEMFVVKHNPRTSTPFGLSPLESCLQQIQYFLEAQSFAGKTASNSYPKKLLYLGQEVEQKQVEEFRRYLRDEIEGRSRIPVIGGMDDVKSIELGHVGDQSLFIQWQTFLISIIAMTFNLDVMKFNTIVGINRSTGEGLDDSSDESAIQPLAISLEHFINMNILTLFGDLSDVAEFKYRFTSSFQDRKSMAVIHQIYAQIDVLTINEMRKEIGKAPLPDDENLGYSKGDLTISEYRAMFGGQVSLDDSVGIDEDTGTTNANSVEGKKETTAAKQGGQVQSQNNNGGNNGVHGAANPKETAVNKPTDKPTL